MVTKRRFVIGASAVLGGWQMGGVPSAGAAVGLPESLHDEFARIEKDSGGRLGIAAFDTLYGGQIGHRADERFPICSTFKLLAAGAILSRVDAGAENLDRRIRFESRDIVVNSAITKDRTGGPGMSLSELCEAAMTWSDNTAGNLLLDSLGGPAGLTAYARSLGDTTTRLDRTEPESQRSHPRRSARHHLAGCHAVEPPHARSRQRLIDGVARSIDRLARRQQERRRAHARRIAEGLARGGQDRFRRTRHDKRRRHHVASEPSAAPLVDLSHRHVGSARASQCDARGRRQCGGGCA